MSATDFKLVAEHPTLSAKGYSIPELLAYNPTNSLLRLQSGEVVSNRRHFSVFCLSENFDWLFSAASQSNQPWIQSLHISGLKSAEQAPAYYTYNQESSLVSMHHQRGSMDSVSIKTVIDCSIDNCIGCQTAIPRPEFVSLQSKCYAAQQCAVTRCVGTPVHMNRPLCNLGRVAGKFIEAFRVMVGGAWEAISQQIIVVVELSAQRRKRFEVSWPEEWFNAIVCTYKDLVVELSSIITSILSYTTSRVVSVIDDLIMGIIDPRVNAHTSMTMAAVTNFISSLFMAPVFIYTPIQRTLTCLSNDISLSLDPSGETGYVLGRADDVTSRGAPTISYCLSSSDIRGLSDFGDDTHVIQQVSVHAAQIAAVVRSTSKNLKFDYIYHQIDCALSYLIGVAYSIADVFRRLRGISARYLR